MVILGKGNAIGTKLMENATLYEILPFLKAMLFDTTQSNTGIRRGAAVIFENLVQRHLLYLGCRHHIFEVYLKTAFEVIFGSTSKLTPFFITLVIIMPCRRSTNNL